MQALDYTPQQQTEIDRAIAEAQANAGAINNWTTCRYSQGIVERGGKAFALFGMGAYELPEASTVGDEEVTFECLPVLVGGRAFRVDSEHGANGVLILMRCVAREGKPIYKGWEATFLETDYVELAKLEG